MFGSRTSRIRRARLVPLALTTAALSSAVLGASVTGTLSAFTASITNSTNTTASGSLVMKETDGSGGGTACLSTASTDNNYASCTAYNKYGGTATGLTPNTSRTTSVRISNIGSNDVAGFTLTPGTCTRTDSSNSTGSLCSTMTLAVTCQASSSQNPAVSLIPATALSSLTTTDIKATVASCVPTTSPSGAAYVTFNFTVALPSSADSSVQGQQVSQTLKWTFTGA